MEFSMEGGWCSKSSPWTSRRGLSSPWTWLKSCSSKEALGEEVCTRGSLKSIFRFGRVSCRLISLHSSPRMLFLNWEGGGGGGARGVRSPFEREGDRQLHLLLLQLSFFFCSVLLCLSSGSCCALTDKCKERTLRPSSSDVSQLDYADLEIGNISRNFRIIVNSLKQFSSFLFRHSSSNKIL